MYVRIFFCALRYAFSFILSSIVNNMPRPDFIAPDSNLTGKTAIKIAAIKSTVRESIESNTGSILKTSKLIKYDYHPSQNHADDR